MNEYRKLILHWALTSNEQTKPEIFENIILQRKDRCLR